jgi:TonB family protein
MPNLSIADTALPEAPAARSSAVQSSAGAAVPRAAQSETLDLMTRFRNPREYTPIPPPDLAGRGGLDPLANRDKPVYSLAINMPNITSYSGSWVIRFAELGSREQEQARAARQQREEAPAPERKLSAPNPRLKVDPKYIRAAAHEGVEGTVVLYAVIGMDGVVRGVRIMRSLDARLDESAVEAFSKWKFDPATSAGSPVDVEAVVEIPFQLAPPEREASKLRF